MNDYICSECGDKFQRYASQVTNNSPTCGKVCQAARYKKALLGEGNPNYQDGRASQKYFCDCGKEKDYRAVKCSLCSKKSSPKDERDRVTDKKIIEIIKTSKTLIEVARLSKVSRSRVSKLVKDKKINVSHFRHCNFRPYTAKQIFRITAKRINFTVKKFLSEHNLIKYKCNECGQGNVWNNKPLILELDHKNGNPLDNRFDNLRYLCSNCHSQTNTFKGKNINAKKLKHRERSMSAESKS